MIGLVPAWSLTQTIGLRTSGVHGKNRDATFQELFHSWATAGFQCHAQSRIGLDTLAPLLPARGAMLKSEFLYDLALTVHNHHVVVILGPVKAGEVSQFNKRLHRFLMPLRLAAPG